MAATNEKQILTSEKNKTRSCSYKKAKRKRQRRTLNKMSASENVPPQIGNVSHCDWYWQNYYNALEWSERHQIAYWRSRSVALEYENTLLHQYVQSIYNENYVSSSNKASAPIRKDEQYYNQTCQPKNLQEVESDEDEKFEFLVNEEMMQFFEQSIRHKMEREKQKEMERNQTSSDSEDELAAPKQIGSERAADMKRIYGKASPMIIGMEAAMQITFDRNCDVRHPKLWPNIPLNI